MENSINQLNKYIKKKKLRNSPERIIVIEEIIAMDCRFTAQSLLDSINTHYTISRASIYNIINLLLDAAIIIRHPFPGGEIQYEATSRAATHHIRICTRCGAIKEFTDQKFLRPIKNRKFTTFETQFSMVYLYGVCKKCMSAAERKVLQKKP